MHFEFNEWHGNGLSVRSSEGVRVHVYQSVLDKESFNVSAYFDKDGKGYSVRWQQAELKKELAVFINAYKAWKQAKTLTPAQNSKLVEHSLALLAGSTVELPGTQ